MDFFDHIDGVAHCEKISLEEISQLVQTPAYVYSHATLQRHCERFRSAFASYPTLSCFAVKANSNLSILRTIGSAGFGADVVSGGELERALTASLKPEEIVFSGVGKTEEEMEQGLRVGIYSFNVESVEELEVLGSVASRLNKMAPFAIRVNPNVDAKTNPYISTGLYENKFGLPEEALPEILEVCKKHRWLEFKGLSCHIGSQITESSPIESAVDRMTAMAVGLRDQVDTLQFLDMGGGLGIRYDAESPPDLETYANALISGVKKSDLRLVVEPGRVIVGNIGVLLTRVLFVKKTPAKTFVIVDAAMNDLLRPSLYKSYHAVDVVKRESGVESSERVDIVGPICETGDFLAKDRELPPVARGDLIMVRSAGAYTATMASNYNSRGRAPEVFVDGDSFRVIRDRETTRQLWANEWEHLR